jgi:hypothetical protein
MDDDHCPFFRLTSSLPREAMAGKIPVLLGKMKADLAGKNLILLANTPPGNDTP